MSIDEKNIIDFIGIDKKTNDVYLTISDHLDWDNPKGDHLFKLQDKINTYLAFIESGEIYKEYPDANGKKIVISVIGKYPLNDLAEKFYEKAKSKIQWAGFDLVFTQEDEKSQ